MVAGLRPSDSAVATSLARLHLGLLRDLERVVDLGSEVTDGACELGVAEQELDGSEVLGATMDQRRLGSAHRVRPVRRGIETNLLDPAMHDPGVVPGAEVG